MLSEEFNFRQFGFGGIKSERLCVSQWRIPVSAYLCYRLVVMTYAVSCLGYIFMHQPDTSFPMEVYLSSWAYFILNAYFVSHFLAAVVYHFAALCSSNRNAWNPLNYCCRCPSVLEHAAVFVETGSRSNNSTPTSTAYQVLTPSPSQTTSTSCPPWYLCVVWILFSISSTMALMVTVVYFSFLFHHGDSHTGMGFAGLQAHVFNSVLIFVEHLVTAVPFRLLHVVYPVACIFIYMVFSIIYWAGDHSRVIYHTVLDWNQPGPTVGYLVLIGFIIVPVLHVVFFLIYRAKMAIYERC